VKTTGPTRPSYGRDMGEKRGLSEGNSSHEAKLLVETIVPVSPKNQLSDVILRRNGANVVNAIAAALALLLVAASLGWALAWMVSGETGGGGGLTPEPSSLSSPSAVSTPSPLRRRLSGLYILERLDPNFGAYLRSSGVHDQVASVVMRASEVMRIEAPAASGGEWRMEIKTGGIGYEL